MGMQYNRDGSGITRAAKSLPQTVLHLSTASEDLKMERKTQDLKLVTVEGGSVCDPVEVYRFFPTAFNYLKSWYISNIYYQCQDPTDATFNFARR
mgnify:CR=1 FL=1